MFKGVASCFATLDNCLPAGFALATKLSGIVPQIKEKREKCMKKRTFDRTMAAHFLTAYRRAVSRNKENPTKENWEDVRYLYARVTTLKLLGIISEAAQFRASSMFVECTAVL